MKAPLCFALSVCALIAPTFADDLQIKSSNLKNGIRFTYLYVPTSKSFSMITFVPIGLAADDAHYAQWSHLCEHLTIRSTIRGDLENANAETMNDCMHLDYYTTADKWREALSHHQRWLYREQHLFVPGHTVVCAVGGRRPQGVDGRGPGVDGKAHLGREAAPHRQGAQAQGRDRELGRERAAAHCTQSSGELRRT